MTLNRKQKIESVEEELGVDLSEEADRNAALRALIKHHDDLYQLAKDAELEQKQVRKKIEALLEEYPNLDGREPDAYLNSISTDAEPYISSDE